MGVSRTLLAAIAFILAVPAPAIAQVANIDPIAARLLAAHNRERALFGSQPMQWDPLLASSAATYGPALATLGRLQHSPRQGRPGQRENLWMGTRGVFAPEQMVAAWTAEKRYFRPGIYPNVSTTGNWLDVSHYTQMVWPTTTRLGCAIYSSRSTDFLICRYSPPGNVDGRLIQRRTPGERG